MDSGNRPLSPHLGVYRWQWTMVYSILHRFTGIALSLGAVVLVLWLVALAAGPSAFETFQALLLSPLGIAALVGWTLAFFYHLLNGVRHMVWDTGCWLDLEKAQLSGHLVAGGAVALTALLWLLVWL